MSKKKRFFLIYTIHSLHQFSPIILGLSCNKQTNKKQTNTLPIEQLIQKVNINIHDWKGILSNVWTFSYSWGGMSYPWYYSASPSTWICQLTQVRILHIHDQHRNHYLATLYVLQVICLWFQQLETLQMSAWHQRFEWSPKYIKSLIIN